MNIVPQQAPERTFEMVSVAPDAVNDIVTSTNAGANWAVTAGVGLVAFIAFSYLFAKASGKLREGFSNLTGGLISKPT